MSEMQALFARQPETADIESRSRAGGLLSSPDARVRVRDRDGGTLLPHGERGEIEVRGPSQMTGYHGDAAATAAAVTADGFVRTGDLGYTEPDGGFVFVSRMGDVLRLGGYLVGPAEIEAHLETSPAVAKAVVVGVATDKGERAYAFVIPAPDAAFDEAALHRHCETALARFKLPIAIQPLDSFPVTESANGTKVRRDTLRRMAVEGLS